MGQLHVDMGQKKVSHGQAWLIATNSVPCFSELDSVEDIPINLTPNKV